VGGNAVSRNAASAPDSTDALASIVADAHHAGTPLRLVGAGGWLDAGPPVHDDHRVSLRAIDGIVEYEPGDLTITVRAGTPLRVIDDATRPHGQWLALDPAGSPDGTIGATVATASWGPLAHAHGTPRDLVLGLQAVLGTGEVIRAGGRVVKNVAGFDLVRLLTGSWGTLGAITEVSLRLQARPANDTTLALRLPAMEAPAFATALTAAMRRLRQPDMTPLAIELLDDAAAAACLGSPGAQEWSGAVLLVRLAGNAARVETQQSVVASIGTAGRFEAKVWETLRGLDAGAGLVARVGVAASDIGQATVRLRSVLGRDVRITATPARGVVRVAAEGSEERLAALLRELAAAEPPVWSLIVECAPTALWQQIADPNATPLAARVRRALDPGLVLNRRR
jgi:glycolate oxidase FAD binding subunit